MRTYVDINYVPAAVHEADNALDVVVLVGEMDLIGDATVVSITGYST